VKDKRTNQVTSLIAKYALGKSTFALRLFTILNREEKEKKDQFKEIDCVAHVHRP